MENVDIFSIEPSQIFMLTGIISDEDEFGTVASGIVQERYIRQIGFSKVTVRIIPISQEHSSILRGKVEEVKRKVKLAGVLRYIGVWKSTSGETWLVSEKRNHQVSLKNICEAVQFVDMEPLMSYIAQQVLGILRAMHLECDQVHGYLRGLSIHVCDDGSICVGDAGIYEILYEAFSLRQTVPGAKIWPMDTGGLGMRCTRDGDIWELGTTIVGMMEGEERLSRAWRTGRRVPPHIAVGRRWSAQLSSFLTAMFGYASGNKGTCEQLLRHAFVNGASAIGMRAIVANYWSGGDEGIGDGLTDDTIARLFRRNDVVIRAPLVSVDDLSTDLFDYHTWQGTDSTRPTAELSLLRAVKVSKEIPLSRDVEDVKSRASVVGRLETLLDTADIL